MQTGEILVKIIDIARENSDIRAALRDAASSQYPASAIAKVSTEMGYPISAMDIVDIGADMYAHMKRSTNGGGENSPVLEGEDDFFAIFLSELDEI